MTVSPATISQAAKLLRIIDFRLGIEREERRATDPEACYILASYHEEIHSLATMFDAEQP